MGNVEQFTVSGVIYGDSQITLRFDGDDELGRRMIYVGGFHASVLGKGDRLRRKTDLKHFMVVDVDKERQILWLRESD